MARMRAPDRRRQLLEVSADLFARQGYRGTTTAALAEAAGITEPILYRHFESKQALFTTLVEEVGSEVIDAWRNRLEGIEDPDERLAALLESNPATHARGRGVYRVIFQAMMEVEHDAEIARAIRRHLNRLHGFLVGELLQLQEVGAVRDDESPTGLAWALMCLAIGYGMVVPLGVRGQSEALSKGSMQALLGDLIGGSD
jgi:AcrR family transcriptional regulator